MFFQTERYLCYTRLQSLWEAAEGNSYTDPSWRGGEGGCIPQEQGHTSAKDSRLSGGPAGEA